jgi:hypothetical protein
MAETTKFWLLVALVCGAFAVAEYMYAREAIRICRDRKRHTLFRILVALVLLVDCLGFLGCVGPVSQEYVRYLYEWGPSPVDGIAIGLLTSPVIGPVFWFFFLGIGASSIPINALIVVFSLLIGNISWSIMVWFMIPIVILFCSVAFVAAPIHAIVMYKAPKRSWWKIIFVFCVTYWSAAFILADMIGR